MTSESKTSRHISLSSVKGFPKYRCEVVSVGYGNETDPKLYHYNNANRRRFSLLQYTLGGEGRFREKPDGPETALPAPCAFLVNCPSPTAYWLPAGGTWEFLYILFVGEMAWWHVEQLIALRGHTFELPLGSLPADLLRRTYQEASARLPLDKFTLSARIYQLLMELYRLEESSPPAVHGIERAVKLIDQEYANAALSVADMARQADLSPFHFSRVFRQQTGLSPYAHLTQVRMNHALNLLMLTRYPIKQVAQLVGFNDCSYFCKIFRHHHRRTPGSIRRQ
jgi:AraC-like DNA-binding protein